jgi:hypothetical protein
MRVREVFPYQPPFLPHHSALIILQDGRALVGRWNAEMGGFDHPVNQLELAPDALAAILASCPDVDLAAASFRVFTCPPSVAERCDYDWTH